MNDNRREVIATVDNGEKGNFASHFRSGGSRGQAVKLPAQALTATNYVEAELVRLRAVRPEVQRIRLDVQRELELAKQMRNEAERYRQEIGTKARSQAQMLILQARLATRKEIAQLKRKVNEEIQQILAAIRMIQIAAEEDFEAQRKFTDAVRIRALSLAVREESKERSENEEEAVGV